jgi:hypothetical protein
VTAERLARDTPRPQRGRPSRHVDDPDTAAHLRRLSARIRTRQAALRTLEDERNQAVREAIAAGWTHAQIAQATGLTRTRVGQIALTNPAS